ncbi:MAG: hypothetical protein IH999_04010 [Proteobacteria bacterium]|nr:hypothetical protein [Pseudomonadota bacterium]
MDLFHIPNLQDYIRRVLTTDTLDPEARANAENFLWDERPPVAGVDLYRGFLEGGKVADLDDWTDHHHEYTTEHILIGWDEPVTPWTFRTENAVNRLRQIDPRIYLIRVEEAGWPCALLGVNTEELRRQVEAFRKGDSAARDWLTRFTETWNTERDKRPLFATTELEVEDILQEDDDDWAERLRDRLGLGHYSPLPGRPPIEVIVMRYKVEEVLADGQGNGDPAIPTVLDTDLSPYFFPSPIPDPGAGENPYYGHAVNLTPVTSENDYAIGCELLHPRIDYHPEHIHGVGVIARPVTMSLEQARRFHLPWVRLASERDDFGTTPTEGEMA